MQKVEKQFIKYVLPSVMSFALSGVYTIVDGFFIGNRLGDLGIAAITLGYPVTALIQAVGTGLGLAGGIRYTILSAKAENDRAERCLGGDLSLMLLAGAVIIAMVLGFLYPLLGLLGAEGEVLEPTAQYVRFIVLGTFFQVLGTGLVPFIRNMGGAGYAMAAMLAGFFGNIVFDWLFVWKLPFGMAGAAWASVLGQAVTMLMAILWLARKKVAVHLPEKGAWKEFTGNIVKTAIAPFGLVLAPNMTLLFMNRFVLQYGGEQALAAYGCIGYVLFIVLLLLQGVGDGCQPLMSWYYGCDEKENMLRARKLAYITSIAIAILSFAAIFAARNYMGLFFGASHDTNELVAMILPWFMAALIFEAYTRVCSAYFYATEQSGRSYILVYLQPVLVLVLLPVLGAALGLTGIWSAHILAPILSAAAAAYVKRKDDKRLLKCSLHTAA